VRQCSIADGGLVRSYGTSRERGVRKRLPLEGRANAGGAHNGGGKNGGGGFNPGGYGDWSWTSGSGKKRRRQWHASLGGRNAGE
jgi:hypothetical protein